MKEDNSFVDEFGNQYPEEEARSLGLIPPDIREIPGNPSASDLNNMVQLAKNRRLMLHLKRRKERIHGRN